MQQDSFVHGDCLDVMSEVAPASVDMIFADLPYGRTHASWDSVIDLDALWTHMKRIMKPHGAVVFTAVQPFTSDIVVSNKSWYRHSWVWCKSSASGFLNASHQPLAEHEDVLVFSQQSPKYHPIMQQRSYRNRNSHRPAGVHFHGEVPATKYGQMVTETYPRSILYFPQDQHDHIHPTQKPLELVKYLVSTYTDPGDLVFDPCAGSATSAIAAIQTGRHFFCIEQDVSYYQAGAQRIVQTQASWGKMSTMDVALPQVNPTPIMLSLFDGNEPS